jgi:hypothetical protein
MCFAAWWPNPQLHSGKMTDGTRLFKRFQILWGSKVWFGTFEYLFKTKVLRNVLQI